MTRLQELREARAELQRAYDTARIVQVAVANAVTSLSEDLEDNGAPAARSTVADALEEAFRLTDQLNAIARLLEEP